MISEKKKWITPDLVVYGDVATLTEACPGPKCLDKDAGLGDDLASIVSTVGPG